MLETKKLTEKVKSFFQDDKKVKILSAVLIAGIVLIALSEFWPSSGKTKKRGFRFRYNDNAGIYAETGR